MDDPHAIPGPRDPAAGPGAPRAPFRRPYRLRAVVFDFDGTLTSPGALDFAAIKREIGCPPDRFVLEWIEALPAGAERAAAQAALERFELEGAAESRPNEGAEDLVRRLRALGLRVGVLTRNGRAAVDAALTRFATLRAADFDEIVTRDDDLPPKPAPDGLLHAAAAMGVPAAETLMVGDYLLDMEAGRAAGAVTALLTNGAERANAAAGVATDAVAADEALCDIVVRRLAELDDVVRLGLPLPPGKLPNDLLAGYLGSVRTGDPAVLVPPGVGEDVAALDIGDAEVLVAHGDPITLSSRHLGRFAAIVNANDIAAAGAVPRWLLTTVLLPLGSTPSEALTLLGDLASAAAGTGLTLVGGHTEISDAVSRAVVSATALGTIAHAELRDKRSVRPGDAILLTKALAMEGTALLAQELGETLRALGMDDAELAACHDLTSRLSIVPEARVAARFPGVRAMHDVTEGGLATALRELSAATGHGVTVDLDAVPVLPLTLRVCGLLGADPLGLIASGSLLVCCRPEQTAALTAALRAAGIETQVVGEVGEAGAGVAARRRDLPAPLPEFAADEAARLTAKAR